jgi:lipopolysaccharide export system protein LptA
MIDHEFYIGNYYYKKGKFEAAASRFERLLEQFPKGPEEDKTLYFLGKSYLELDQWQKAELAFMKIVTEYPKGPHYKEAKAILDKGLTGTKVSLHKTNTKESKGKRETTETEHDKVFLIRFEEEGKQPVPLREEKKVESEKVGPALLVEPIQDDRTQVHPPPPSDQTAPKIELKPDEEKRVAALPNTPLSSKEEEKKVESEKVGPALLVEPIQDDRTQVHPPPPSDQTAPKIELKPDEEKRVAALPNTPLSSKEEEKVKKQVLPESLESKLSGSRDEGQPIDIVSDKVDAHWKENLILFTGNVIARQKDIVIYADSIEAVIIEDGKGIDRVIAGGNVKIQQGLRVANCQKAIFYNLDRKFILTGDPKVSEGDNIVSGDEIIFDIEKNQVEVKGGPSGRGKAKIQPGGEIQKLK